MADRLGQQLGNYRLIRLLGRGGFAEVYLGEHLRLGTQAGIKVLHTRLASKDDVENFEKEARTIAHLKHPHIVRVLDYDVEDDTPFLVMDYAPGGTLRKRHPKGTILPLTTIISYVKQIADALQYAHVQRVIHRDIKPENMLVGEHNALLLSDFGIAIVAQSSRYQSTKNMGGTMAYIAPEQIQGHPRTASDQYSLGIVVYEWLSGDCPFHGSMTEIVAQHLAVPPPPLHVKVPTISFNVEQVVLMALAKDPLNRFASVQAFVTALEQACQAVPPLPAAPPPEIPVPSQPSPQSNMVATISPSQSSQPTNVVTQQSQSLQPAVVAFQSHTPNLSSLPLTEESVPSIESQSLRPSQHRISRRTIVGGLAGLVGVCVTGGGIAWLAHYPRLFYTYYGHANVVRTFAWSPNGERIASGSEDHTVQVWDALNGRHTYVYRGHSDYVLSVAWSPSGKHIASASGDKTVQVWDAADGGHVYTYRGHTESILAIAWSPDGKSIASCGWDNVVQVWDAADGGHVYTYRGHTTNVSDVAWSPDGKYIASASYDRTVQVWNAVDGSHVYTYSGYLADPRGYLSTVAWSPNSQYIASASYGQPTVQVWGAMDGRLTYVYRGHSDYVISIAWSPDGKRIASGSEDKTVQVWNAADGGNVYTYRGHADFYLGHFKTGEVYAVAWSPDGTRIASGSRDETVQVWQAV